MQIGRVARSTRLSVDTIRFYEKQSLIPPAQRTDAGYRVYDESTVDRLQLIGRAESRFFTPGDQGVAVDRRWRIGWMFSRAGSDCKEELASGL
jgi:MerR family copper efflux transcriptional regulator